MSPSHPYKLNREPSAAPGRKPRARTAAPHRKGLLTKGQLARLCIAANQAAEAQGVTGWREVSAWRHEEQLRHFGLASLTTATQDQYADLKAHFEALAGKPDRAFQTALRGQSNKWRIARWNLGKAIKESGLGFAYAFAICKRQYRCNIDDATEQQLWQLVYTIRNRAASHKQKAVGTDEPF
jgi:hypothetical protein